MLRLMLAKRVDDDDGDDDCGAELVLCGVPTAAPYGDLTIEAGVRGLDE